MLSIMDLGASYIAPRLGGSDACLCRHLGISDNNTGSLPHYELKNSHVFLVPITSGNRLQSISHQIPHRRHRTTGLFLLRALTFPSLLPISHQADEGPGSKARYVMGLQCRILGLPDRTHDRVAVPLSFYRPRT